MKLPNCHRKKNKKHVCHGQKSRLFGDKLIPPFNDGILISWGPINPYGLGLMSLSPIIWNYWEFRFACGKIVTECLRLFPAADVQEMQGETDKTESPRCFHKNGGKM